jgi:hypothetical protein
MRFIITAAADPNRSTSEAAPPPDEKLIAAYMMFNEEMHKAGVLVASEGLNPAKRGARIGVSKGRRKVLDGPFAESKELVGGFYLIEVASLDDAIGWAMRCPVGLGTDDILTIHPMTEAADLPPEVMKIILDAAPTWSASFRAKR